MDMRSVIGIFNLAWDIKPRSWSTNIHDFSYWLSLSVLRRRSVSVKRPRLYNVSRSRMPLSSLPPVRFPAGAFLIQCVFMPHKACLQSGVPELLWCWIQHILMPHGAHLQSGFLWWPRPVSEPLQHRLKADWNTPIGSLFWTVGSVLIFSITYIQFQYDEALLIQSLMSLRVP